MVPVAQKYSAPPYIEFCPVGKVATTTIKRIFLMKKYNRFDYYINPYDISFLENYNNTEKEISNASFRKRFMFVRNPYDRLLLIYVDKLLGPNPFTWKTLGVPIKRSTRQKGTGAIVCGNGVTFKEFTKYTIGKYETKIRKGLKRLPRTMTDGHFETMANLCKPCSVNYEFIGKIESFRTDLSEFLKHLHLRETDKLLSDNGNLLAAIDAINATVYQPFDPELKKDFDLCNLPFAEIIQTTWLKLQIHGLIGRQNLTLSQPEINELSYQQFLTIAIRAFESSTIEERLALKKEYFQVFYSTIDHQMREKLKDVYADDFYFFEYSDELEMN